MTHKMIRYLLAVLLIMQPLCGALKTTIERSMKLDGLSLKELEVRYEEWKEKEQKVLAELQNIIGIAQLAEDDDDVYGIDNIDRQKKKLVKELVKLSLEGNEIREFCEKFHGKKIENIELQENASDTDVEATDEEVDG